MLSAGLDRQRHARLVRARTEPRRRGGAASVVTRRDGERLRSSIAVPGDGGLCCEPLASARAGGVSLGAVRRRPPGRRHRSAGRSAFPFHPRQEAGRLRRPGGVRSRRPHTIDRRHSLTRATAESAARSSTRCSRRPRGLELERAFLFTTRRARLFRGARVRSRRPQPRAGIDPDDAAGDRALPGLGYAADARREARPLSRGRRHDRHDLPQPETRHVAQRARDDPRRAARSPRSSSISRTHRDRQRRKAAGRRN